MPISVTCPACGCEYSVRDDAAGRKFRCQACEGVIDIPGAGGPWLDDEPSEAEIPERRETALRRPEEPAEWPATGGLDIDRAEAEQAAARLGRASVIIGLSCWGLSIIGVVAAVAVAMSLQAQANRPLDDEQALLVGLSACGPSCLGLAGAILGTVLAVVALMQEGPKPGSAIKGLLINGGYLVVVVGLFVITAFAVNR